MVSHQRIKENSANRTESCVEGQAPTTGVVFPHPNVLELPSKVTSINAGETNGEFVLAQLRGRCTKRLWFKFAFVGP